MHISETAGSTSMSTTPQHLTHVLVNSGEAAVGDAGERRVDRR
jgi:hypothetical protein